MSRRRRTVTLVTFELLEMLSMRAPLTPGITQAYVSSRCRWPCHSPVRAHAVARCFYEVLGVAREASCEGDPARRYKREASSTTPIATRQPGGRVGLQGDQQRRFRSSPTSRSARSTISSATRASGRRRRLRRQQWAACSPHAGPLPRCSSGGGFGFGGGGKRLRVRARTSASAAPRARGGGLRLQRGGRRARAPAVRRRLRRAACKPAPSPRRAPTAAAPVACRARAAS